MLSCSIPSLVIWRILQAFGAFSGTAVGSAVIRDIYKFENRGFAMSVLHAVKFTDLGFIRHPLKSFA